jgi:phage tail-like protein
MATGDRKDPLRGYNFKLEIDGIQRAGFRECKGLDTTSEPVKYREGTDKVFTSRQLPAQVAYGNITLITGLVIDEHSLWDWRKKTIDGKTERKNGSICLHDEAGEEKYRWNFVDGWPTKYELSGMNATANEVMVETLTIVHEGFTKA